jgi:flagellar hook-associated protein FlgK
MGKITISSHGYEVVTINGKTKYVHRLLAEEHIPNPNNYKTVNHINGNKRDNRIENLEWLSRRKNSEHARLNGLSESKLNGIVDLTKEQVLKIRQLRKEGNTFKTISNMFKRDYRTIWDICNFKRYKDYGM